MNARLVGIAALIVLSVSTSGSASIHPTLALVDRQPVTLRGRAFHPLERVRVTVIARGTEVRSVRATSTGSFRVRFVDLTVPRCGGMFARARGSSGSLATLKIPLPECLPA